MNSPIASPDWKPNASPPANPRIARHHRRLMVGAGALLLAIWAASWIAYCQARNAIVTADKVRLCLQSVHLGNLTPAERARALRDLAVQVNALSREERRKTWLLADWTAWQTQMSEREKAAFMNSTVPAGLDQMLTAFDKLSPVQRQRTIDESVRRLQEARSPAAPERALAGLPPVLSDELAVISPELRQNLVSLGLETYYRQTSAQSKADLAPLLEEMQRTMETGWLFKRPRPPRR